MTVFAAWILFPLLLGLLGLGCGLLLEAAAGVKLPQGLHIPVGIAVIIVVGEILTKSSSLAPATTPLVVVLALAGFVLARPWRTRPRIPWWPLGVAVAVYLVYLAPVLFSGDPTWTGFVKLDDTATWMTMTDRLMSHGHEVASLAPSTYQQVLVDYLTGGEPVGAFLPWGVGHQLLNQDLAWLFQPYLAFLGGMIGMTGWAIARPLVRSPALRGAVAFFAAQAALLYGYSQWGGIKEVAAALMLVLSVACVMPILEAEGRLRSLLPLLAATFALLGIDGFGGMVWLPVTLIAAGAFVLWVWVRRASRPQAAALIAGAGALVVVAILKAISYASATAGLRASTEIGNLAHRVRPQQVLGVWPAADFRIDPPQVPGLTDLLMILVIVGLILALVVSWRERSVIAPLCICGGLVGAIVVSIGGSPWLQGKAFATASPAFLLIGLAGLASVFESPIRLLAVNRRPRSENWALGIPTLAAGVAVAVGVLWSNVLTYTHVTLAPYGQMRELSLIGQRFAGQGPTMLNENDPYGARHFLRDMDPESPSDRRRRPDPLRDGSQVPKGGYSDLDQFQISTLLTYRTIVIRSGPVESRPPAPYQLVYNGPWYQVWQRPITVSRPIVDSIPLGGDLSPVAVPSCQEVAHLAQEAGRSGVLAAASRPPSIGTNIPQQLNLGRTSRTFNASTSGTWEFWLGGAVTGHLSSTVDGKQIGSTDEILPSSGFIPLGKIDLTQGPHRFSLDYSTGGPAPGSSGPSEAIPPFDVGPLEASRPPGNVPVLYVSPARYRSLCGKAWDWVEAIGT